MYVHIVIITACILSINKYIYVYLEFVFINVNQLI